VAVGTEHQQVEGPLARQAEDLFDFVPLTHDGLEINALRTAASRACLVNVRKWLSICCLAPSTSLIEAA
jgi:hypothetical protein